MFNRIAVVVVSGGLLAGCATQQQNNTAIGAGAGAAVGAGLGALIGNGKGAAIGAASAPWRAAWSATTGRS